MGSSSTSSQSLERFLKASRAREADARGLLDDSAERVSEVDAQIPAQIGQRGSNAGECAAVETLFAQTNAANEAWVEMQNDGLEEAVGRSSV